MAGLGYWVGEWNFPATRHDSCSDDPLHWPLLPIVVMSGRSNIPGGGRFKYTKRKKLRKGDDLTFFAMELRRVYDFWSERGQT